MRDLREISGARDMQGLPVPLTFVRTLEEFDGPRLAEFKSEQGDTYLYHWCDRQEDVSRWMVFRTPAQELAKYLVGVTNLRHLITRCRDGIVYLLDLGNDDTTRRTFFVTVESVPQEYLPTERSFYDPAAATNEERQDVFINDDLAVQKVWDVRRKYFQAYNFLALFGPHGNATEMPEGKIRYTLKGGWVRYTLFSVLARYVLGEKRVSLAEVAAASPGYVRFNVNPSLASDLRSAVTLYMSNQKVIDETAQHLYRWIKEEEPMTPRRARSIFNGLCGGLGIGSSVLLHHTDLDVAIDMLKSYLNRLEYFAIEERERSAMLVGLKRP
jgi:hypothetical protein